MNSGKRYFIRSERTPLQSKKQSRSLGTIQVPGTCLAPVWYLYQNARRETGRFLFVVEKLDNRIKLFVQRRELLGRDAGAAFAAEGALFTKRWALAALKAWSIAILLETVAAVDWLAAIWLEWDFARSATFGTRCRVHRGWEALTTAEAATTSKTTLFKPATKTATVIAAAEALAAEALFKHRYRLFSSI